MLISRAKARRVAGNGDDRSERRSPPVPALAPRAGARRIEHDGVEGRQFIALERSSEQVSGLANDRTQARAPWRRRARARRAPARRFRRRALHGRPPGAMRRRPTPQNRSATRLRALDGRQRKFGKHTLALERRLKEAARRRTDARRANAGFGRAPLDDDLAVVGQPRNIQSARRRDQCLSTSAKSSAPQPSDVDIEPGQRRGDIDIERLADATQTCGQRARRIKRARHARREHRTGWRFRRCGGRAGRMKPISTPRLSGAERARETSRAVVPRHARRPARRAARRRRHGPAQWPAGRASTWHRAVGAEMLRRRSRRNRRNTRKWARCAPGLVENLDQLAPLAVERRRATRSPGRASAICERAIPDASEPVAAIAEAVDHKFLVATPHP